MPTHPHKHGNTEMSQRQIAIQHEVINLTGMINCVGFALVASVFSFLSIV